MAQIRRTEEAVKRENRRMDLEFEALKIFHLVVAEWTTDPLSTQCFDLNIVEKNKRISKELLGMPNHYAF